MIQIILGGETCLPEDLTPDQRQKAIVQCETLMHMLKQGCAFTLEEWDNIIELIYLHFDFVDQVVEGCDGWSRTSHEQVVTRIVYFEGYSDGNPSYLSVFKVSVNAKAETILVECEGFPGWSKSIAQARNEFLLGR